MNMVKLGIVSTAGNSFHVLDNPRKYRLGDMSTYTLCEVDNQLCRNRNRHSFAFYISAIIGNSPIVGLRDVSQRVRKVAVLVPLQLILITESHGVTILHLEPLQSLLGKASVCFRALQNYSSFVTFNNPLKTALSHAACGFGGFRLVQLSLSNRALQCEPAKTALSQAVRSLQRKNWVRTVTKYYSTFIRHLGDYLPPQKSVAQLNTKRVLGGCHA